MAFLDLTKLNDFQAREATNEKREANYGMVDLVADSTPFVDYVPPSVQDMLSTMSGARSAVIPYMKDQTVIVNNTPGFSNIPINMGEAGTYLFSAYDIFSGFRYIPSAHANNVIDSDWWFNNTMRNVLKAMAVAKDDILETVLEARKTQVLEYTAQVSQGAGVFTFNAGTDTLEISKAAQQDTMFTYLTELMRANQLAGNYRIVNSPGGLLASEVTAFKNGGQQAIDLLWSQSALSPDRRYVSDQLSAGSDNFNGFFVRDGAIGMYNNFPYDFVSGTEIAGRQWSISDVEMPYIKSRPNIYLNKEAVDGRSLVTSGNDTNLIMTTWEEIALWDRFYVVYRVNSDLTTRVNDIVKLKGLTT